jgi:hypothetical protein
MYDSLDKYTVRFTRQLDNNMLDEFHRLICDCEYMNDHILGAFQDIYQVKVTFEAESSYDECHLLLWLLYQAFGEFELSGHFKEIDHPPGCWYETELQFQVDGSGYFELEIDISLSWDEENAKELDDYESDEECLAKNDNLEIAEEYLSTEGNMEELDRRTLADFLMSTQP